MCIHVGMLYVVKMLRNTPNSYPVWSTSYTLALYCGCKLNWRGGANPGSWNRALG